MAHGIAYIHIIYLCTYIGMYVNTLGSMGNAVWYVVWDAQRVFAYRTFQYQNLKEMSCGRSFQLDTRWKHTSQQQLYRASGWPKTKLCRIIWMFYRGDKEKFREEVDRNNLYFYFEFCYQ